MFFTTFIWHGCGLRLVLTPFSFVRFVYIFCSTSYTIHLIRETSNTTTATNYALEGDIKDEASVPAVQGSEDGPYLELIKTIQTTIPEKYILTKTQ